MSACDWLQVYLSGCRLPQGADWLLPWNQKFEGWLCPVLGGSPPLSQTASMHVCVPAMFVKIILKPFAAGGAWSKRGVSFFVAPGFPLGPGLTTSKNVITEIHNLLLLLKMQSWTSVYVLWISPMTFLLVTVHNTFT